MFDWQSSEAQASIAPPHPPSPSSAPGHWAVCRLDWTLWSLFAELWEQDLPTCPEYVRAWRGEVCEDGAISTKTTVKLQKEKVACDAKILTAREFSYLFSAESRQREERWDRLPKIQSGGWDWSGCEVIGLGARVAKIKQVCSVTTRGGEKERGRKRGEREIEGGVWHHAEGPDNWWRTPLLFFLLLEQR